LLGQADDARQLRVVGVAVRRRQHDQRAAGEAAIVSISFG
jgi:hypothetical protein